MESRAGFFSWLICTHVPFAQEKKNSHYRWAPLNGTGVFPYPRDGSWDWNIYVDLSYI